MKETILSFPYVVILEVGQSSGGTVPPLTDGAAAVFRASVGKMFLRNQTTGLYHELIASRVVDVAMLGCTEVGVAFSALPPYSTLDNGAAPADGHNMVMKPASGKLYARTQVAPFLYFDVSVREVLGTPSAGIEETGLSFASLPPSSVPNVGTAADGQDAIYRPATGRLYLRNRNGGLYHELAIFNIGGSATVSVLSVGVLFSSIL